MIRALQEEVCAVVVSPSRMSGQGHFTEDQNRGQLWGMAGRKKAEVSRSPPGLDRSSGSSARLGLPCSKSGHTEAAESDGQAEDAPGRPQPTGAVCGRTCMIRNGPIRNAAGCK